VGASRRAAVLPAASAPANRPSPYHYVVGGMWGEGGSSPPTTCHIPPTVHHPPSTTWNLLLYPESWILFFPHLPLTTYHLAPLFSITFALLTAKCICFHRHSRFTPPFSTAILWFHRHSRIVRSFLSFPPFAHLGDSRAQCRFCEPPQCSPSSRRRPDQQERSGGW
jgi:hypothetical protein